MLAIAFSESSLNYDVVHKDVHTKGIGGIKTKFHNIKNHTNSLLAIEEVWMSLLDKHKGNFSKALKHYKGTVNNYKSYNITMRLYERLKDIK